MYGSNRRVDFLNSKSNEWIHTYGREKEKTSNSLKEPFSKCDKHKVTIKLIIKYMYINRGGIE